MIAQPIQLSRAPTLSMPSSMATAGSSQRAAAMVACGASEIGSQGRGRPTSSKPSRTWSRPGSAVQIAGGNGTS